MAATTSRSEMSATIARLPRSRAGQNVRFLPDRKSALMERFCSARLSSRIIEPRKDVEGAGHIGMIRAQRFPCTHVVHELAWCISPIAEAPTRARSTAMRCVLAASRPV